MKTVLGWWALVIAFCLLPAAAIADPAAQGEAPTGTPAATGHQPPSPGPGLPGAEAADGSGGGFRALEGPRTVELGHELTLDLPEHFVFLEHDEAKRFLESMGNVEGDDLVGVVAPGQGSWIARLSYEEAGYVKDDDADDLDAKELLEELTQGTAEANKEREARGFKPMRLDGWTDPPRYDRGSHHLVWGIKGSSDDGVSVNHYTRILGRRGFVAVNVIDDPEHIATARTEAQVVLAGTRFKSGARYEDFDAKTDKVAEYGLAALIAAGAGAAALKGGLLAKLGKLLLLVVLAAKKALVPLILVAGAGLKALLSRFGGQKPTPVAQAATGSTEDPGPPPPAP